MAGFQRAQALAVKLRIKASNFIGLALFGAHSGLVRLAIGGGFHGFQPVEAGAQDRVNLGRGCLPDLGWRPFRIVVPNLNSSAR